MSAVTTYRDLEAWQLGMKLVEAVYGLTRLLPREERYGLSSQLRRAAVSIPSNIAEGQQLDSDKLYLRHLSMALGSEAEVQTQLELLVRLHLATTDRVQPVMRLASRTGQVVRGLRRSIKRRAMQH
jgi:four helix bundle protein